MSHRKLKCDMMQAHLPVALSLVNTNAGVQQLTIYLDENIFYTTEEAAVLWSALASLPDLSSLSVHSGGGISLASGGESGSSFYQHVSLMKQIR